jgi:hypothetical protein
MTAASTFVVVDVDVDAVVAEFVNVVVALVSTLNTVTCTSREVRGDCSGSGAFGTSVGIGTDCVVGVGCAVVTVVGVCPGGPDIGVGGTGVGSMGVGANVVGGVGVSNNVFDRGRGDEAGVGSGVGVGADVGNGVGGTGVGDDVSGGVGNGVGAGVGHAIMFPEQVVPTS